MVRPKKHGVDELDIQIITELMRNPRVSLEELGQRVGRSASTCKERRDYLEKNDVICRPYTIHQNASAWKDIRVLLIKLNASDEETIEKLRAIANNVPEIVAACTTAGSMIDAVLWVESLDGEHFEKIRRLLKREMPMIEVNTVSVIQMLKHFTRPINALIPTL